MVSVRSVLGHGLIGEGGVPPDEIGSEQERRRYKTGPDLAEAERQLIHGNNPPIC